MYSQPEGSYAGRIDWDEHKFEWRDVPPDTYWPYKDFNNFMAFNFELVDPAQGCPWIAVLLSAACPASPLQICTQSSRRSTENISRNKPDAANCG